MLAKVPRPTTATDDAAARPSASGSGRDEGAVSARNSSKGALVAEAHAVFRALGSGASVAEVRDACLTGKLLRQRARETRNRIWDALHWRYFAWDPAPWVLTDLAEAAASAATDPRFLALLYVHYARRDRLTFDFVTGPLWAAWKNRTPEVARNDLLDFLVADDDRAAVTRRWSESTRVKLAGSILSALRDFGVLHGVNRKVVQRPVVPLEAVLHVCRLLHHEGLRGRSVVNALDFRLFLWEPHDVAFALGALAQRGAIRFERSGRIVMLEVPPPLAGARA